MALFAYFLFVIRFPSSGPPQVSCCRSYPLNWACQTHVHLDYVHLYLGSHSVFSWRLFSYWSQPGGAVPFFSPELKHFFLSHSWLHSTMATNDTQDYSWSLTWQHTKSQPWPLSPPACFQERQRKPTALLVHLAGVCTERRKVSKHSLQASIRKKKLQLK